MIPEGWREKPLDDLADYINGRAFKPADWKKSGLPIIRIAQITNPNAELDYYDGNDVDNRNLITNGDLIFSWSATLATIFWDRGDGVLNQHLFKVVPRKDTDKTYLKQLIDYSIPALADHSHGSTMKHIKRSALKDFTAPIPPLPEQKRIAEVLGGVDAAIEATKAVIEQTKKVKQGLLQNLLTRGIGHTKFKNSPLGEIPEAWKLDTMGNLTDFVTSGSRGWAAHYADSGALFVRITNLNRESIYLDLRDSVYVRLPANNREGTRTRLQQGDILISITAELGMTAVIPDDSIGEAYVNQHIALVRLASEQLNSHYLAYFIASDVGQRQLKFLNDSGTKAGLNLKSIRKLQIPVPPHKEREAIVEKLDNLDNQINAETTKLASLQQLKKGLMHDLLTGKVRVKAEVPALRLVENNKQLRKNANNFRLVASAEPIYIHGLLRAEIASQLGEAGAKKTEKVVSLAARHCGLEEKIDRTEVRHAAGPYDGVSRHKIDDIFKKEKWFTISGNGEKITYKRSTNYGRHKQDYQTYLSDYATGIQGVIDLLKDETPEFCEKVATLYAAWNDLLIDGKRPTDAQIFAEFWRWHTDKKQFTKTELQQAIAWMRRKNLVPTGKGRKTKVAA